MATSGATGRLRPRTGTAALAALAALTSLLAVADAASADLGPGSRHALRIGHGDDVRLAMPLPTVVRDVRIVRGKHKALHARVRIRLRAANWKGGRGVARDRVMVTFRVARRLLATGPDPSAPRWHKAVVHQLRHRTVERTYTVRIPTRHAAFLRRKGAFAKDAERRRDARRLLWADVQQDRDFLHVDGHRDWREGNASNAAGLRSSRRSTKRTGPTARAAGNDGCGANSPCGTLTVQNQTANGVYGPTSPYADASGTAPGHARRDRQRRRPAARRQRHRAAVLLPGRGRQLEPVPASPTTTRVATRRRTRPAPSPTDRTASPRAPAPR